MSRAPGNAPQFDRLINDLIRAKDAWARNDRDKAERILKMVASIAYSEARERGPNDPVPEVNPYSDEQSASEEKP